MILLPAIDIADGRAVRLAQGDFDAQTTYDADPLEAARRWADAGARWLHVVDLDGARTGTPVNLGHVARIAALSVPVQVGGGLRSIEALTAAIGAGAARAILGTAALSDIDLLDEAVARYGERVVVSVDGRAGRVATSGWTEQTDVAVESIIERLGARGVQRFVYSSIERDGMLSGPDLDGARRVASAVRGSFVYSGGIAALDHLRALVGLRQVNLAGVIVGTALYEGRFTIAEAHHLLDGRGNGACTTSG